MAHRVTLSFPSDPAPKRITKNFYIDLLSWQALFVVKDEKVSFFVGPELHRALYPYSYSYKATFLNENGNAYKGSSFEVAHTVDAEEDNILWGRQDWKDVYFFKHGIDDNIRVKIHVKSITSSSELSLAVLNSFLGEKRPGVLDRAYRFEFQAKIKEIEDWEKMMKETLVETQSLRDQKASLEAILESMMDSSSPARKSPSPSGSGSESPSATKKVKVLHEPAELSCASFEKDFGTLLGYLSGPDLKTLEEFLVKARRQVEEKQLEERLCVVCMAQERAILMRPCNHLMTCGDCAKTLMETTKKCPTCRADVVETINPFC